MCVILGVTGGNATVRLCDLRNAQSYRSNRFPGNFIKNLFFFCLNPAGHFATQGHSETQTQTAHATHRHTFLSFKLLSFQLRAFNCSSLPTSFFLRCCLFLCYITFNHIASDLYACKKNTKHHKKNKMRNKLKNFWKERQSTNK